MGTVKELPAMETANLLQPTLVRGRTTRRPGQRQPPNTPLVIGVVDQRMKPDSGHDPGRLPTNTSTSIPESYYLGREYL